ncbi:snf2 family helicase ATPase [Grosmannia clavigera kw1407]|uniref:Snf2 family helicase ATPase n=1 Tax=Grosmannia clavigera (strain kw1407 / UAMH 11150) TaxID=655863 RepID=F0X851_GROCL|nr:snf2 family helicase ATPase [Grosmannia clavigera kw1407]EFX05213.1 snf2 family helicase ATPase [Grosmannia clavigera kw1407]
MADSKVSSVADAGSSAASDKTSLPSSPPPANADGKDEKDDIAASATTITPDEQVLMEAEERRAQKANAVEEQRRMAALRRKQKKKAETKAEREEKAKELDELLRQSAAFSDILTKKTQVLGRVGSGFDGKALGEHDLKMAAQPKCLVGGTMRDYQLEGLTWMLEICLQNMSGILADEMGLGKTVQTISLIALLREQEQYLGPHLIVAPLSTLSNWVKEFNMWTPSIPVVMYHGTPPQRKALFKDEIQKHLHKGRPTEQFPVVCTSYEIILRDRADLAKINWEFIIIDEGHRMKNFDSKLFRELQTFRSATRFLITGTPLQNNLKELWSLLNFLMPKIFTDWEAFSSWFDFSELQDEEGTAEFVEDRAKQALVKKIHMVLQPLLLRRVKADVASYLPKKREYILYAPMTKEQTDLYNAISDKTVDTRSYLENMVVERLTSSEASTPARRSRPVEAKPISVAIRSSSRAKKMERVEEVVIPTSKPKNAFAMLMGKTAKGKPATSMAAAVTPAKSAKRKVSPALATEVSLPKSAKSSRHSTPTTPARGRSRSSRRTTYLEVDASDEDKMSDAEFEAALLDELLSVPDGEDRGLALSEGEIERAQTLEVAKREIGNKKLGNPLMQLRLVCNSPHNFYNPWLAGEEAEADQPIDESIVTASGKMLLLDRLLPSLFERGHKVLIFSQFKTQLDLLEAYCAELRGWAVCRIDGSVAHADRQSQIELFNADAAHRLFLLSTRAGGQGINLASADTVILFDSDWNPQQDLQAQDRAHRIGQTRPVVVYRLATKGTVEEELLLSADAKRRLEKLVIKKGGFRTMDQKMADGGDGLTAADLDADALKALLLKDGQVYEFAGDREVLSDRDLDVLCDRSDEAYAQAASGQGDADAFRVIETGADGITESFKKQ